MPAPAGISLAARGAVWAGMEGNSGQLPEQTRLYQRIAAAAGGGIRTVCETVRRRGTDGGRASGDGRDHVDARGRRGTAAAAEWVDGALLEEVDSEW